VFPGGQAKVRPTSRERENRRGSSRILAASDTSADPGRGHQRPADRIHAHDLPDLPVQCRTMLKHRTEGLQQRPYGNLQQTIIANWFSYTAASNAARLWGCPIPFVAK